MGCRSVNEFHLSPAKMESHLIEGSYLGYNIETLLVVNEQIRMIWEGLAR